MYDIAIIGGGICGCFIARQLSRYQLKTVLLEKHNDVSNEATKANSGIIHSGYDAEPGTLKARLNRQGNPVFDAFCNDLGVRFKRIGSLTIALTDEDVSVLRRLYERGQDNRIPGLSLLDADQVRQREPHIHPQVRAALFAETAGILDPFMLAIALAENAAENGTEIRLESKVIGIQHTEDGYTVMTENGSAAARYVINCGGVFAQDINELLAPARFTITPRKGEYIIFDKRAGGCVNHVIFQCPSSAGKGVLVSPTIHGNLLVGPNAHAVDTKDDVSTTRQGLDEIAAAASRSIEDIPMHLAITNFSGLRATPNTRDFIIEELEGHKGFINVAGIESPGLTASPAIADEVIALLQTSGLVLNANPNFNPARQPIPEFAELSEKEKEALIHKNPLYGRIICRCETITEAQIVESIHRKVGSRTVDGVKRRVRAGMGRCQGGFCGPRVLEILARELHTDKRQVLKDGKGSYLLSDRR